MEKTGIYTPYVEVFNSQTDKYSYFWAKYIHSVDLSLHCAKSLVGEYHVGLDSQRVSQLLSLDQHQAEAYYICAVTDGRVWERNVHLLAKKAPGETHTYKSSGMYFVLYNLKPIEISPQYIDEFHPHAHKNEYSSCRNWQAAWWLHKVMGITDKALELAI